MPTVSLFVIYKKIPALKPIENNMMSSCYVGTAKIAVAGYPLINIRRSIPAKDTKQELKRK